MSGSWEIIKSKEVLVVTLHTEITTMAWSYGLRNLIVPGQVVGLSGMPFDHARNQGVMIALQNGFKNVFFLDSDVIPPHDCILRLLQHNLPIVSALYCRRSPPHGIPVMIKDGKWVTDYVPGSLVEVDYVGAGALLVHRSVFEKMPPQEPGRPWFNWKVDKQGILPPGECLSEDFTFCLAARRQLGIKTIVDTSIRCKHIGYSEYTEGSVVPLNTTPVT